MKNIKSFGIIMAAFLIAAVFTPEKAFAQTRICDVVSCSDKRSPESYYCSEDTCKNPNASCDVCCNNDGRCFAEDECEECFDCEDGYCYYDEDWDEDWDEFWDEFWDDVVECWGDCY